MIVYENKHQWDKNDTVVETNYIVVQYMFSSLVQCL